MMKKFISIVLTICMLFSLITVTTAAEISEDDRLALLKAKDYTFIDINPNIDAFASADVVRDYAAYFGVEADDSASAFNELHTEDGYTYRTRIPSKTHGGIDIDGTESYYKKGIGYFKIDAERIHSTQGHSPSLFSTESFWLSAEELKTHELKKYAGVKSTTTAKMVAADPETYAPETFNLADKDNGYNYMPDVDGVEEVGSNYNVILKDNNSDAKFKIGPMNDKEFVKNAVDYAYEGGKEHTVVLPTGVKGDSIAIAATTANINSGSGSSPDISFSPAAALLSIEIKYTDNDVETKYMVITSLTNANDMVSSAIVYGEKYDNGIEIDYTTETAYYSQLKFMDKGTGLTFADVTFPENVSGGDLNFGFALRANQHDTGADFSNMINVGTFSLKDKEISTIKFVKDEYPGDNAIGGIIPLYTVSKTSGAISKNVRALVPVEVAGGEDDKVYFLYVGRVTQQSAVFGATVINKSLQDKIDAINAKLKLVDDETTESDCEAINKEIQALKAESDLVKDSDFNKEKYDIIKEKLLAGAQKKIKAVEAAIEGLADTYTYSMKETFVSVYADYDFLINNGIDKSEINPKLVTKIEELNEQFEKADKFENMVSAWKEYSYTMNADVVDAYNQLEEISSMVAEETVTTVEEYYQLADKAKEIDKKINALNKDYATEMLEEVLAIEAEVNEFVENGGSRAAFEHIAKLEELVKSAADDILKEDIIKVTERIEALKELPYSTEIKAEIEALDAEVKSIEERGGEVSAALKDVIARLLNQKNEAPFYVTQKLNYSRDIFEDVKKYTAQGYADKENKVYVYPADAWQPTVTAVAGNKMGFDEGEFVNQLKVDNNNFATVNNIPYQFGPIISAVHGKNNEPNSINAADSSSVIEIDVNQLPYEELYLVGWTMVDKSSAVITYKYADGSTSTEMNLKAFRGGYTGTPSGDEYTEILNPDLGIPYWRAYSSTAVADQTNGYGGYRIYVFSHKLTPDDKKVLKSIKIEASQQDLNVLALTGKVANSGIISNKLDETMAAFAGENTDDQVRNLVKEAQKYMDVLDGKKVAYEPTYATTVQQYKEEYITVESVECYTDTDNRNITVKFTGAIDKDSISNQNFVLKKDGVVVENYKVEMVSDKEVKITFKNAFDYECAYSLEISANVSNDEKTVTLGATEVYDYDGLAAVDVKVTYEDKEIKIYVKNNLNEKLENFVVMTGAFNENNALVKFEPVSGSLEAGAEFTKTIVFNTTAPKISCDVITSLDEAKLIFGHIDLK